MAKRNLKGMQEITSTTNNLVKETAKLAQKKYRTETKLFLVEGQKAIEEALALGVEPEYIFILKEKIQKFSCLNKYSEKIICANEAVLKKISTTDTAPEIVAIAHQIAYKTEDLKEKNKIVLLENIKDSGNLGTILRTCAAFGADAVVLAGDAVDIYNPKTVRSAVGNIFKIPFFYLKNIKELKEILKNHEFSATLVEGNNLVKITEIKLPEKAVIMFGSEADGLTDDAVSVADKKITIPIAKNVESLNLSTAVTICLWELLGEK